LGLVLFLPLDMHTIATRSDLHNTHSDMYNDRYPPVGRNPVREAEMATCLDCGLEAIRSRGCLDEPFFIVVAVDDFGHAETEEYMPIRYGQERQFHTALRIPARCESCLVLIGGTHHSWCEIEECPRCGETWNSCPCDIFDDDEGDDVDRPVGPAPKRDLVLA
jgi:hypothetical protein